MKQDNQITRSRLPKMPGLRPVPMRLTEDERAALNRLASKESRSASNMARMVFLRGMEAFKTE